MPDIHQNEINTAWNQADELRQSLVELSPAEFHECRASLILRAETIMTILGAAVPDDYGLEVT